MKIVISHSKTKREIDGGFAICASESDLRHIIQSMQYKLDAGHTYGWIDIPAPVYIEQETSGPPLAWDSSL